MPQVFFADPRSPWQRGTNENGLLRQYFLRPRCGEEAHRIVLDYARTQLGGLISEHDLEEAKEIRQDRALAEYGDFSSWQLDRDHVRAAAEVAERIVNVVAHALAEQGRFDRGPSCVPAGGW